jgi:hypothetical protein
LKWLSYAEYEFFPQNFQPLPNWHYCDRGKILQGMGKSQNRTLTSCFAVFIVSFDHAALAADDELEISHLEETP